MNRLLSSETFRNRVGVTVTKGRFDITHQEDIVLGALRRIANDLAQRDVVLGDIWDIDGKRSYLDRLESWALRAAQQIRTHVENEISRANADLDTETLRKGSPHSLIAVKNQGSCKDPVPALVGIMEWRYLRLSR